MIPKDAVSLENFERMERGLPPRARPKVVRTEPIPPVVPDQIAFKDIPTGELHEFNARSCTHKNSEGSWFTGYNVFLETRDGKTVQGWLPEGEFIKLKLRIQVEKPEFLKKIGL